MSTLAKEFETTSQLPPSVAQQRVTPPTVLLPGTYTVLTPTTASHGRTHVGSPLVGGNSGVCVSPNPIASFGSLSPPSLCAGGVMGFTAHGALGVESNNDASANGGAGGIFHSFASHSASLASFSATSPPPGSGLRHNPNSSHHRLSTMLPSPSLDATAAQETLALSHVKATAGALKSASVDALGPHRLSVADEHLTHDCLPGVAGSSYTGTSPSNNVGAPPSTAPPPIATATHTDTMTGLLLSGSTSTAHKLASPDREEADERDVVDAHGLSRVATRATASSWSSTPPAAHTAAAPATNPNLSSAEELACPAYPTVTSPCFAGWPDSVCAFYPLTSLADVANSPPTTTTTATTTTMSGPQDEQSGGRTPIDIAPPRSDSCVAATGNSTSQVHQPMSHITPSTSSARRQRLSLHNASVVAGTPLSAPALALSRRTPSSPHSTIAAAVAGTSTPRRQPHGSAPAPPPPCIASAPLHGHCHPGPLPPEQQQHHPLAYHSGISGSGVSSRCTSGTSQSSVFLFPGFEVSRPTNLSQGPEEGGEEAPHEPVNDGGGGEEEEGAAAESFTATTRTASTASSHSAIRSPVPAVFGASTADAPLLLATKSTTISPRRHVWRSSNNNSNASFSANHFSNFAFLPLGVQTSPPSAVPAPLHSTPATVGAAAAATTAPFLTAVPHAENSHHHTSSDSTGVTPDSTAHGPAPSPPAVDTTTIPSYSPPVSSPALRMLLSLPDFEYPSHASAEEASTAVRYPQPPQPYQYPSRPTSAVTSLHALTPRFPCAPPPGMVTAILAAPDVSWTSFVAAVDGPTGTTTTTNWWGNVTTSTDNTSNTTTDPHVSTTSSGANGGGGTFPPYTTRIVSPGPVLPWVSSTANTAVFPSFNSSSTQSQLPCTPLPLEDTESVCAICLEGRESAGCTPVAQGAKETPSRESRTPASSSTATPESIGPVGHGGGGGVKPGSQLLVLPCGHCYHQNCVQRWLIGSTSCPMCRRDLTFDATTN